MAVFINKNFTLTIGKLYVYFNSISLILKINSTGLVKLTIKNTKY